MPSLDKILERKKEVSGQVSAQTRTLALGTLAISWALLTVHDEPLRTMATSIYRPILLGLAVCSVLVIVFDLFQYVAATQVVNVAAEEAEHANPQAAKYNNNSAAYILSTLFYRAKFVLLIIAGIILVVIFIQLFSNSKSSSPVVVDKPVDVRCSCTYPPVAEIQKNPDSKPKGR